MNKLSRYFLIAGFVPLIFICAYLLYPPLSPLSPLGLSVPKLGNRDTGKPEYVILGFAPYWNLKKLSPESLNTITQFAYFALLLDDDGSLYTHANRREQDPGYTNYRRLLAAPYSDKPLTLTFMPESQESLESILSSKSNRARAVKTIVAAVDESIATGVNIDFEPLGETSPSLRTNFTLFTKELKQSLCPSSIVNCPSLSLSVYASAAARPRLWDLAALEPLIDHLVVMTYDYTLPGNSKTGPNSPLRGAGTLFEHDILTNLAEITSLVPSTKVLLGIPFYGYEWDTPATAKYTPTNGRGSVASLERIGKLIEENTLELLWDRNTLTPYAIRREEGEVISQIYFEDENSIRLKLELVKQANLGGIAIWALGYEGNNPSLWEAISRSLNSP